jgi:hypothetical protein
VINNEEYESINTRPDGNGTLLVMLPYFLVTLRVERKYLIKRKPELDTPALTTTVRIMNDITYGILAIPIVMGAVHATMKFMSNN